VLQFSVKLISYKPDADGYNSLYDKGMRHYVRTHRRKRLRNMVTNLIAKIYDDIFYPYPRGRSIQVSGNMLYCISRDRRIRDAVLVLRKNEEDYLERFTLGYIHL
jgi:hypothetical protein